MSQIQKKFIKANAVDESKILLLNDGALRARNAADSADVSLLKLDASNVLQFLQLPQVPSLPSANADVASKEYVDQEVAGAQGDVTALEVRVQAIEDDYGVAGGLATLDGSGLVPSSQLPSYVDDVLEYADLASFPATGEQGKIYVALDTNKCYRWSGSAYIYITSGAVDSVNSQTGVVVLDAADIGLAGPTGFGAADVQNALENLTLETQDLQTRVTTAESDIDALEAEDLTLVKLDGSRTMSGSLDLGFNSLINVAAPVAGDDAANKTYVDTADAGLQSSIDALEAIALEFTKEKFVLDATDISNGYIGLANLAVAESIVASVDRLMIHETDDYTVSVVSGVTRITFAGSLITIGQEKLSAGDVVRVTYAIKPLA